MDKHEKKAPLRILKAAALAQDLPIRKALTPLALCIGAAILSGAGLPGGIRPFGWALAAAASGMLPLCAASVGAVVGALSFAGWEAALIAALVLIAARTASGVLLAGRGEETVGTEPSRLARIVRCGATESIWLRAAWAATAAMTEGVFTFLWDKPNSVSLLAVFGGALLAPAAALAFCTCTEKQLSRTAARDAGTLTFLFAFTRAFRDAPLFPFHAGVVFAFCASMAAARAVPHTAVPRRIMGAAVTGLLCGMAMDPGGAPIYAAAAVAAAAVWDISETAAVCAGWITGVGLTFAGGGLPAFAAVMPEMTTAAAVLIPLFRFKLLPPLSLRAAASPSSGAAAGEAEERAEIRAGQAEFGMERMRSLAASLHSMSGMLNSVSEKMRRPPVMELKELCDRAVRQRCGGCPHEKSCWEREYASTSDMLCRMTAALHRDGRVSAALVPASLASRCHRMSDILDEINENCAARITEAMRTDRSDVFAEDFESFSQALTRCVQEAEEEYSPDEEATARLRRTLKYMEFYAGSITVYGRRRRRVVARNLDLTRMRTGGEELRDALEKATGARWSEPSYRIEGDDVSMSAESIPRIRAEGGSATRSAGQIRQEKKGGRAARTPSNGDCAVSFETDDGRHYTLICDGMGTGGEASVTSRLAAVFLNELLRGGTDVGTALSMLNNYLRSRSMEVSAGVDLMEIDRYTGIARFVKSGAAPSFVVREGRLFRLCSRTVPIGILRALDAEMIRFELLPGDIIVMLSDGVTESFEDSAWLCDMLTSSAMTAPPEEIAARIVRAACAGGEEKRCDDVTAAVVKIAS